LTGHTLGAEQWERVAEVRIVFQLALGRIRNAVGGFAVAVGWLMRQASEAEQRECVFVVVD